MIATIVLVIILLIILGTLFDGYFIVRTREAAILERLGKFQKVAHAGLHFKMPWIDRVRDKISLSAAAGRDGGDQDEGQCLRPNPCCRAVRGSPGP